MLGRDESRQVVLGDRVRVAVQLEAVPLDLDLVAVLEPLERLLEAAAPEVADGQTMSVQMSILTSQQRSVSHDPPTRSDPQ